VRLLTTLALLVATALGGAPAHPTAPPDREAPRLIADARVLAISVDGLNPQAIRKLGVARAPVLNRLVREGAATLNARTDVERTVTLPNHTSMVTGRRIDAAHGGHGVTWNDDFRDRTVQQAAGHPVDSVFTVIDQSGGGSAVFAGKDKFSLFPRSWPGTVDRFTLAAKIAKLVTAARSDLRHADRELTFLHLGLPDETGHRTGFMSPAYLDAVAATDRQIGRLVRAIDRDPELSDVTLVLTADHGGPRGSRDHGDATKLANYRVPFLAWGAGVAAGDLYAMNPTRTDPKRARPSYAAAPPVRNGDLANVITDLLGLPAVAGSEFDATQDLRLTPIGG
jgi:predicted AlkP superfamily pyrophosphatase or phosphodiesterase